MSIEELEMLKEKLVGAQLITFDEKGFTVVDGNITYTFEFVEDRGDCCGYNEIKTNLVYEEFSNGNPIIVDVKSDKYSEEYGDGMGVIITLLGESKKIAEINSYSSSRSGWCYGACVMLNCVQTNENYILSEW